MRDIPVILGNILVPVLLLVGTLSGGLVALAGGFALFAEHISRDGYMLSVFSDLPIGPWGALVIGSVVAVMFFNLGDD